MVNQCGNIVEGNVDRIVYERFFIGKGKGVFVDVGAASPDFLSISALYRNNGWRVISVEPNPFFCELHKKAGSEVLQYACGDHDEDDVDFVIVDQHGEDYLGGKVSYESFSSLSIKKEFTEIKSDFDKKIIKTNLRRLDSVLGECASVVDHIDILSIDVEGWEMEVLNGFDINKYKPKIIIIENLFRSRKYIHRMNDNGYVLWRRYYPNDVYKLSSCNLFFIKIRSYIFVLFELIEYFISGKVMSAINRIRSIVC